VDRTTVAQTKISLSGLQQQKKAIYLSGAFCCFALANFSFMVFDHWFVICPTFQPGMFCLCPIGNDQFVPMKLFVAGCNATALGG
jgi:hypothetical protein